MIDSTGNLLRERSSAHVQILLVKFIWYNKRTLSIFGRMERIDVHDSNI
jgi:hypothetical protein